MPMHWRRIAWFVSSGLAIVVAWWMRSEGFGWWASLGAAAIVWVVMPFVISQLCGAVVLMRMDRRMRDLN
jgi:hypothetical protein